MKSEEKEDDFPSWTNFDIAQEEERSNTTQSQEAYPRWMESLVRVTCAGFCGALVGMSRQNQASASKIFQRSIIVSSGKKRPPKALPKLKTVQQSPSRSSNNEETNLPLQWAFSFMAFVSILETSRFWSPTTLTMNLYAKSLQVDEENEGPMNATPIPQFALDFPGGPRSFATIVDCTIGGIVAGLAGGMAKQRPPPVSSSTSQLQLPSSILKSGRRSLILTGLGTGMALGFLAGTIQAGLDVVEDYAIEEEARQKAEREAEIAQKASEEEADSANEQQQEESGKRI